MTTINELWESAVSNYWNKWGDDLLTTDFEENEVHYTEEDGYYDENTGRVFINQFVLSNPDWWGKEEKYLINKIPNKAKVLELGCGTGRFGVYLKDKKSCDYTGVDTSQVMIDICKQRGLNVFLMDAKELNFSKGSFDVILIMNNLLGEIFANMSEVLAYIESISELLSENGIIIISSYYYTSSYKDYSYIEANKEKFKFKAKWMDLETEMTSAFRLQYLEQTITSLTDKLNFLDQVEISVANGELVKYGFIIGKSEVLPTIGHTLYVDWLPVRITYTEVGGEEYSQTCSETLTNIDNTIKFSQILRLENLAPSDMAIKQANIPLLESTNLSDVILKSIIKSQIILESSTITGIVLRKTLATRIEALTVDDKRIILLKTIKNEILSITDKLSEQMKKLQIDSLSLSDSILSLKTFIRSLIESSILTDIKSIHTNKFDDEIFAISDIKVLQSNKSVIDSKTLIETTSKAISSIKTESLTFSDSAILASILHEYLSETIALAELCSKKPLKMITENNTISDTLFRIINFGRIIAEQTALVETISKKTNKIMRYTISSDDIANLIMIIVREFLESMGLTDTPSKKALKIALEDVSILEITNKLTSFSEAETLSIIDIFEIFKVVIKSIAESMLISDSTLKLVKRNIIEQHLLEDILTKSISIRRIEALLADDVISYNYIPYTAPSVAELVRYIFGNRLINTGSPLYILG